MTALKIQHELPEPIRLLGAVLDCFPEHVAVLDESGRIVVANRAWIEFGRANSAPPDQEWVGVSYLAACRDAEGCWLENAREAGEGIRAVLAGVKEEIETVYPCQGPREKRWFRLRASGFNHAGARWVVVTHTNLTNLRRLSEAATTSELHFRNLVDNALTGVMNTTLEGRIIFVNQALARMFEFDSPEQMQAQGMLPRWRYPEHRQELVVTLKQQGYVNNYETEAVTKTGKTIHTLISATLHDDVISSMVMDITDRKEAERVLRESTQKLRKAQEIAHLGYWQWDIQEDIITWSDEVYRIYGIDPGTPLTYERLVQSIHPEDREYHHKHTAEWLENRGGAAYEYRIVRPDGSTRYIYAIGEVECDEAGEPVRFLGAMQDVTEPKRAEKALRVINERFRATFEQAAVGIAHVAPDGRFLRINQKYCDIVGYSQNEMMERTFQDITYPDDLGPDLEYVRQLLGGDAGTYSMEKRYFRKDGELVWVNLTVSLVRNEAQEPQWFVALVQDISARKQAEDQIKAYQNRLKALASQLTLAEERERRRIAIELHDHVGQSMAFMRMQLAAARKESAGRKVGAILDEVSGFLRQTIQNTRDVIADLSSPTMNELGLAAAISEWLKYQVGERYGLALRFSDDGELKPLSSDVEAILFRNVRELLTNAVKHANASRVSVSIQRQGAAVQIVVEDDGIGLTAGKVSEKKAGGFGLFSIEERMRDLGGSLEIASAPGRGVKAILTVPLDLSN